MLDPIGGVNCPIRIAMMPFPSATGAGAGVEAGEVGAGVAAEGVTAEAGAGVAALAAAGVTARTVATASAEKSLMVMHAKTRPSSRRLATC